MPNAPTKKMSAVATGTGQWTDKYAEREKQQREMMLGALARVMQTTDRILTGKPVTVKVEHAPVPEMTGFPAWTMGANIVLNRAKIEDLFQKKGSGIDAIREAVVVAKGTNFHEVAHLLFTPGAQSAFRTTLKRAAAGRPNFRLAWNILEDQRIETLYTSLYQATSPYFVQSACHWLLYEAQDLGRVFPLTAGRLYLPADVRSACRSAFVDEYNEQTAVKVETIVDQYMRLDIGTAIADAMVYVREYTDLLEQLGILDENNAPSCSNSDDHAQPSDAVAVSAEELARAIEKMDEQAAQDDAEDDESLSDSSTPTDDESDDESDAESGLGEDEIDDPWEEEEDSDDNGSDAGRPAASDANGNTESDDESDESHESDDESDDGTGNGAGAGSGGVSTLTDLIEDALADSLTDESFNNDIDSTTNSVMAKLDEAMGEGVANTNFTFTNVPASGRASAQKIMRNMQALRTDLEPAWVPDQPTGRLNIGRVIDMHSDPTNVDIFDTWDEGSEEDATTEVVVLLDHSYSMEWEMGHASEAMWIIKRAFDMSEIPTTVYGFSDDHTVIYRADEKAHPTQFKNVHVDGGTMATDSLKQAHRVLTRSEATNRVCIAITDGAWFGNAGEDDQIVADMRHAGVTTVLFTYGDEPDSYGTHNFENLLAISDAKQVVEVVDTMIESIVKSTIHR